MATASIVIIAQQQQAEQAVFTTILQLQNTANLVVDVLGAPLWHSVVGKMLLKLHVELDIYYMLDRIEIL